MYVERPYLEEALNNALKDTRNIIIHGESGCGKSWLFKKVFAAQSVPYMTVNMANASRLGGVNQAFEDRFNKFQKEVIEGKQKSKEGQLDFVLIKGGATELAEIKKLSKEPFELCLEFLQRSTRAKRKYIVVENMERILNDEKSIDDISNLITLVDDEDYAEYGVRILIVGVPHDVQKYFTLSKFGQTIANRLVEIPEVARLPKQAAEWVFEKGFNLLQLKHHDRNDLKKMLWLTDFIPQHIHEFGLSVAQQVYPEKEISNIDVERALGTWIQSSFTQMYAHVESKMNSRQTRAGRRDQTIYSLATIDNNDFKTNDVERVIRQHFPRSTDGVSLNIAQILAELADGSQPLIRKTPKGDAYRFVNPKIKICARAMLNKNKSERVVKKPIDRTWN